MQINTTYYRFDKPESYQNLVVDDFLYHWYYYQAGVKKLSGK
jgi:hypothetical protein